MQKLSANEIREKWLTFFKSKEHVIIASSSLIPIDDPSLLWINSGVATLKPYFDGRKNPPAPRLTNSQRSIRTNDIENVGLTARHHTMFEMLGNFSIGDYFKKEAILYAWQFLTDKQWLGLDADKLYITVYENDQEAFDIWTNTINLAPNRIIKGTRETNFWDIGEGPCGPNTEIFYDRGNKYDSLEQGLTLLQNDIENDRYLEIWNIVFSEFNHLPDNTYVSLPRKNIDTGAGLERIASVMQDTPTNFETDLFLPIIKATESMASADIRYHAQAFFTKEDQQVTYNTAFKVIADHIRAVTFAIADGIFPSNKDRGYIIRRLIRRAALFGRKLGITVQFLYNLVNVVCDIMQPFYNYLLAKQKIIIETVYEEETKFMATLEQGLKLFENIVTKDHFLSKENTMVLFESYGFPIELIIEEAHNRQINVDETGFNKLLTEAKEFSRQQRGIIKGMQLQQAVFSNLDVISNFCGYDYEKINNAQIIMMIKDNQVVDTLTNETGIIILDQTPFYAEKGGQAADTGIIKNSHASAQVIDVQQGPNKQHLHQVMVSGQLTVNDVVSAQINHQQRFFTRKNHSATHLLHAALREVLGNHVMQIGSFNNNERLRIDISHNANITNEQLQQVDQSMTKAIQAAIPCEIIYTDLDTAINHYQALAFFTEKYDEEVRIIKFGSYSCELCGGTHVNNTQEIEEILITNVESKGSGVYRISAISSFTTINAYLSDFFTKEQMLIKNNYHQYLENCQHVPSLTLPFVFDQINNLEVKKANLTELKTLSQNFNNQFKQWQKLLNNYQTQRFIKNYQGISPVILSNKNKIIAKNFTSDEATINFIKNLANDYQQHSKNTIIIFTIVNNQNYQFFIAITKDLEVIQPAQEIMKQLNNIVPTQGGGNKSFVQGSFTSSERWEKLLQVFIKELNNER